MPPVLRYAEVRAMNQEPHTPATEITRRAAAEAGLARRLREAGLTLRRFAGAMTYHPMTGARPEPSAALTAALEALSAMLNEIDRGAAERAADDAILDGYGGPLAREIRAGHQALMSHAQATAAALQVLRTVLSGNDGAALDAPYGASAPRRAHPGALCTVVAERAEGLAAALETVAVLKANVATGMP
jgi:hypothetical protein